MKQSTAPFTRPCLRQSSNTPTRLALRIFRIEPLSRALTREYEYIFLINNALWSNAQPVINFQVLFGTFTKQAFLFTIQPWN